MAFQAAPPIRRRGPHSFFWSPTWVFSPAKASDHGRALEPFHRLRHRQGLPPRRRGSSPSRTWVSASRTASRALRRNSVATSASRWMWGATKRSPPSRRSSRNVGAASTGSSIRSASRPAKRSPATSWTGSQRRVPRRDGHPAYSFPALAKAFMPLMKGRNASILTLTYIGG